MTECPDVSTPWGQPCKTCGATLPNSTFERHLRRRDKERQARIHLTRDPGQAFGLDSERGRKIAATKRDLLEPV